MLAGGASFVEFPQQTGKRMHQAALYHVKALFMQQTQLQ
jgi:hypothetical protein